MEENMLSMFNQDAFNYDQYDNFQNYESSCFLGRKISQENEDFNSEMCLQDSRKELTIDEQRLQMKDKIKDLFFQNYLESLEELHISQNQEIYEKKLSYLILKLKLYKYLSRGNFLEAHNLYHRKYLPIIKKRKTKLNTYI